jgi:CRISPR-associated protein Cas2
MPRSEFSFSGYRAMWLFALYDLPVKSRTERRDYQNFHNLLLEEGFSMLQYSVYARYCSSEESSDHLRERLRKSLPQDGQVRLLSITDRQFGRMEIFLGRKKAVSNEKPPPQLLLF